MKIYFFALMLCATATLWSQNNSSDTLLKARADAHAPISIMADHTHDKGQFMVSYRYMYMNMSKLKSGSEDVPFSNALKPKGNYRVTPTRMPMQMHMIGAMYAPTDQITLMAMTNFVDNNMQHVTAMGLNFKTATRGWGDTQVSALYQFYKANASSWHAQLGVSLPTGSIDEKAVTPASNGTAVVVPYPMQLGSGTYDGILGLTYSKRWSRSSFGAQAQTVLRFGENDNAYTLGNRYQLQSWFAAPVSSWVSFSVRGAARYVASIDGANPDLNPMMVITADTANSGGTYVEAGLGANFLIPEGVLKNLRLGIELQHPIYQNLKGVQLKTNEVFTAGLQYAF